MNGCSGVMEDGSALEKQGTVGVRLGGRANFARKGIVGNRTDFEYERRMNNWRLWRLSERKAFGGSPFPIYNLTPRPPRGENVIPILAGEADETERAIQALPLALRRAVE